MASSNSEYSQTLQHITDAKLAELSNKRQIFLKRKAAALEEEQVADSRLKKLRALSDGVKTCFDVRIVGGRVATDGAGSHTLEILLANLDRFLKQAEYDPSISPDTLERWRRSLLSHLEMQTLKYEYATLFAQLTMEWLSIQKNRGSRKEVTQSDDFEKIASAHKLESRKQWEDFVFTPVDRDPDVIKKFLSDLFTHPSESTGEDPDGSMDGANDVAKALEKLRKKVTEFEASFNTPAQFNSGTLAWVMSGLLDSDLLTDEQKAVLKGFQNDRTVQAELSDVLNMRLAALYTWSWGTEVAVEQRRQLNGSYQVRMHEDLIQAIFLQYLGVKWSIFFKDVLKEFRASKNVWKSPRSAVSTLNKKRRQFFLDQHQTNPSLQMARECIHRKAYFVSQLLDHVWQERRQEEGEEEAEFERSRKRAGRAKQSARKVVSPAARFMQAMSESEVECCEEGNFDAEFFQCDMVADTEEESDEAYSDHYGKDVMNPTNPTQARQNLLSLLSADVAINKRLYGEITCFRTQYESLYPSLPHQTILAVLSFLGVSEKWIDFFDRFLTAPLRFTDDVGAEPRIRRRGTPGSHVLSEVFGESTLFCLDFMINKESSGELSWRINDDMWFWSRDQDACVAAWKAIQQFNEVMGISLDASKSGGALITHPSAKSALHSSLPAGKIRWGMLYLNAESGRFEIDQEMVDGHIDELTRQLEDKKASVFSWIQAWNAYATTFFTYNFGTPANCFGQEHVDMMLQTHERIQRKIFSSDPEVGEGDRSVITYLRNTISSRFGNVDIPDGYFFLPIDLGGLELSSSFINLINLRDSVLARPDSLLDEFFQAEKDTYNTLKRNFTKKDQDRIIARNNGFRPQDADNFMSFEEYTQHRELVSYGFKGQLVEVYDTLLKRPKQELIDFDTSGLVAQGLSQLNGQLNLTGIQSNWRSMSPYWMWVAQLYGPEIVERFGGFNIVDPGLLPIGLVSQFQSGRVSWREE